MLVINYPSGPLPSPSLLPLTLPSPPLYWHFFQVPLRVCLYPPMFLSGERHYHSSHLIPSPPSPPPPLLPPLKDFASFLWQFTCTSWVHMYLLSGERQHEKQFHLSNTSPSPPPPPSPFQDFASFLRQFTGTHLYSWVEKCSMRSTFIYLKQAQAQALAPHPPFWDFACFPNSSHEPIYTSEWREVMCE